MTMEEIQTKVLDPKKLTLPEKPIVHNMRVFPLWDPLAGDALEVWVIIDDSTTRAERTVENRQAIRRAIEEALLAAGIEWYPLCRFIKVSEQKDVEPRF